MSVSGAIVIGGGLMGVTTAYELARRGVPTTLLEAQSGFALGTSYANGSMLTPSMSDPWNAPGVHRHLAASLFHPASPMKLRVAAIPSLLTWGPRFLLNSGAERHRFATTANFMLARYSLECMRDLREALGVSYDAASVGTMKVFRDGASMAGSRAMAEMLLPLGLRFEVLDAPAAVEAEPQLRPIQNKIVGALRFPADESGDARKFCDEIARSFVRAGGIVETDVTVEQLKIEGGRVCGVCTQNGAKRADAVIIAAGHRTRQLVKPLRLALPIRPAKGYTITFDIAHLSDRPIIPLVDDATHAAVVPIGTRLRIAGTAEFAGEDLTIRRERIAALTDVFRGLYPHIAARVDFSSAREWAGLRPMSADGLPFIGPTRVQGLYINSGHGHLGWTLAAGSARLLGDLIMGAAPSLDPNPYRATR